jgi:hypothetical protein
MKTLLFVLLLAVALFLAGACGFFLCQRRNASDVAVVPNDATWQRDIAWERDQLEWDLRVVRALNDGDIETVLGWSNLRINYWMVNRTADSRPSPFPDRSDDSWSLRFSSEVARQRAEHPVRHEDALVEETISNVLQRALEITESAEPTDGR